MSGHLPNASCNRGTDLLSHMPTITELDSPWYSSRLSKSSSRRRQLSSWRTQDAGRLHSVSVSGLPTGLQSDYHPGRFHRSQP